MNRIIILALSLLALATTVAAQEQADSLPQPAPRYGYLSYDSCLHAMPEYALCQDSMAVLRQAFEQELKRVEAEFNEKYEAFLEGQRDFPRTILLKRQTELQQLMQRNIDFKAESRRELQQAEARALLPLRQRLSAVLASLAAQYGLELIVNTDANACPFIDPTLSIDLQQAAIDAVQADNNDR